MKRIIGYTLAVVLGGGFWTWVAAATVSGVVRAWWRHLTDTYGDPARHMIHAETGPQPSSPADAARINAGAEYPIRIDQTSVYGPSRGLEPTPQHDDKAGR